MIRQTIDPEFQVKLDQFNASQGPPSRIELAFDCKKNRWVVFAVPFSDSSHPLARNYVTRNLKTRFPDDSGREGIRLFTWCETDNNGNDIGFKQLDDRLFTALHFADSFKSKTHFDDTIKKPELAAEARQSKQVKEAIFAAREYWHTLDRLLIAKSTKSGGDWRWRNR
jgi:hypothetical protein